MSLITVLPGEAVYTAFGHSALRVRDPARGLDRVYNYGTFDFDSFFLPTFLYGKLDYGKLDYMLSVRPFEAVIRGYRRQGRPVIEQRLLLGSALCVNIRSAVSRSSVPSGGKASR